MLNNLNKTVLRLLDLVQRNIQHVKNVDKVINFPLLRSLAEGIDRKDSDIKYTKKQRYFIEIELKALDIHKKATDFFKKEFDECYNKSSLIARAQRG